MAKKMKAQAENKPISAKELKFWLEGILEFQAKDWVPNAEQWKGIQDKIFNLEDVAPQIVQYNTPRQQGPVENVFSPQQNGGATGQPVASFPSFTSAPAGFESAIPNLPIRDENGFLKDPNDIMSSRPSVQLSNGTKVIQTNEFD